ncbi:MAG: T9SS type A sorting domain-containing protein [Saprospiraceae bacterium]
MRPIFTPIFFFLFSSLCAQDRLYVNALATGANNGLSWTDAFDDLHSALGIAQSGDSVWVAEGTYKPTSDTNRDSFFFMQSGVRLFGGFEGTESDISQRDWAAHPTVLSGDIGVQGDSTDNAYNILVMEEAEDGTLFDGLSFRHGNAKPGFVTGDPYPRNACGGGLSINAEDGVAYPVVRNCRFEHNYAFYYGGAAFVRAAADGSIAPQFINCVFEGNTCQGDGGAIYCNGFVDIERIPDFGYCRFTANKSSRWGEAVLYKGPAVHDTLHIWDCNFDLNGDSPRGVIENWTDNHVRIERCNVEENYALFIAYQGLTTGTKSCYISECDFTRNQRGAFLTSSLDTKVSKCVFQHNFGSGPSDISINMKMSDCVMDSNRWYLVVSPSRNCDTCIFSNLVISNNKPVNSNGLWLFPGVEKKGWYFHNIEIVNNDSLRFDFFTANDFYKDSISISQFNFIDNKFYLHTLNPENYPPTTMRNSLFYGNQYDPVEFFSIYPKMTFENCAFDDLDCSLLPPTVTCSNNLIGLDPLFHDTAIGDYSLLPCSPLINAGSNAAAAGILTDLAGNPRIQEGTVDIGAYEAPAFALAAAPQVAPACVGYSNGSISISPVLGCEPYDYNWLPAAGNGPELNGLPPGDYLLTITDGSGRQILDTVTVSSAPSPILSLAAADVQCGTQAGGSLSASVLNGAAPYHYQWLPVAEDTAHLSQQKPGLYALTVTDANGCQDSSSASIALLGMLTLMVDGQTISCNGSDDGWLSALPATGASPFSWLWQGWPGTDSIAQPLGPGAYAVTVTDVFGCTAAFAFPPMAQPDSLSATVVTQDQTDLSMPNGAAVVTGISGGMAPYGFDWSTGSTQQAIAGLTAGDYMVTVTDKNGCEVVVEAVVDLMVGTGSPATGGEALLMYPNPAVDWVKVVFPKPFPGGVLELSDASGRVLRSSMLANGSGVFTLDLRGLPGGNYVVTLWNGAGKGVFAGRVAKI